MVFMSNPAVAYRRVLLKLSGEALLGEADHGIDPDVIDRLAQEIRQVAAWGVQLGVVNRRRQHLPGRRPCARGHDPRHW